MASCQEDQIPASKEGDANAVIEAPKEISPEPVGEPAAAPAAAPLAQAIQEEEKKAAAKYGNMRKKQSDVMRKRMMGGGKQYFDSGDYNVGKSRPTAQNQMMPQTISPEQPAPEKLRNRKASIPNKTFSRLQS